jgi:hypothetical protein
VTTHLTDEQVSALLCGVADEAAAGHAAACAVCAAEVEDLRGSLGDWKRSLDEELAARPLPRRPARLPWLLLASAAALVLLLLAPATRPVAMQPIASPAPIADQELLTSIDVALQRELPQALEPASLLVADLRAAEVQNQ